jgi:cytochrome P450
VDNFLVGPVIDRARARWIVGRGILFIDEPEHRLQRRLILPSMHRKRIETYQQVMREVTTQVLDRWQPGVDIDVASEMDDLALVIEGRTLFSMDFSGTERALSDAVTIITQTMNDVFRIAIARLPFDVPGIVDQHIDPTTLSQLRCRPPRLNSPRRRRVEPSGLWP